MNAIRDRIPTVSFLPFGDDTDDVDDETPEDWERQGRLAKLWTMLSVYPFLTASIVFLAITLVLYLYPVVPRAHRNLGFPTIAFFVVVFAAWGLWNRMRAYAALERVDLHINFKGETITPRLCERTTVDDDGIRGYKILRRFDHGGLFKEYEEFRHRHSRREISEHKEKYHRVDDDGSGAVVDGVLEAQTADADTIRNGIPLFNEIAVTHTGRQRPNMDSKEIDSVSTIPPTIDSRTSAKVRAAYEKQALDRRHIRDKFDMLQDQIKEMEEYVDPAGQPLLEDILGGIQMLNELKEDDQRRQRVLQRNGENSNGGDYQ